MTVEPCSPSFHYPGYIYALTFLPRESCGSSKMLNYMYLGWVKLQSYLCSSASSSGLCSLTLKPAAFEEAYFPLVKSEASGGRNPNTNKVHNIESTSKLTNNLLFVRK